MTFFVLMYSDLENQMNSIERVNYYATNLEEEAARHSDEVRPSWPEKGRITFSDVHMRYRPGLPLVLNGLTMDIQGGERIGIVGRTGAGKSSIMSALFRLIELSSGTITIDGVDIASVGLHDLRKRLAIIPQDPTHVQRHDSLKPGPVRGTYGSGAMVSHAEGASGGSGISRRQVPYYIPGRGAGERGNPASRYPC